MSTNAIRETLSGVVGRHRDNAVQLAIYCMVAKVIKRSTVVVQKKLGSTRESNKMDYIQPRT